MSNMAKECFIRHYASLTEAVAGASPLEIANALVAKGLVGQHVADGMANAMGEEKFMQASRVLQDVFALISVEPKAISSFLEVLDHSGGPTYKTVVATMRKERKKQYNTSLLCFDISLRVFCCSGYYPFWWES